MIDHPGADPGSDGEIESIADAIRSSAPAMALLGLATVDAPQVLRRHATTGLLDCLALAQVDAQHSIALRASSAADAGRPCMAMTNVVAGESAMIAESPASWLPIWVVTKLFAGAASPPDRWLVLSDSDWHQLEDFHRRLGGDDDLKPLRNVIEARDSLRESSVADALTRAAPGDRRGRFQRDLAALAEHGWIDDFTPAAYGSWREPMIVAAGAMADPPDAGQLAQLLQEGARQPSNHDAEWCHPRGFATITESASSEQGGPVLIARTLVERVPADASDPWRPAIERLASAGSAYDGRAHVDLVRALHAAGDVSGAFRACLTAAFWTFRRHGRVPAELQLLAGRLAHETPAQGLMPIVSRNLRAMGVKM